MSVREEDARAPVVDGELLGYAFGGTCDEVVVTVHVSVSGPLEAPRDCGVRFAATPERLFRCAGPGWGQRFPNVTEEDDPLEVRFQKIEEGEETIVVVPEHVASIARSEVEVG